MSQHGRMGYSQREGGDAEVFGAMRMLWVLYDGEQGG